MSTVKKIRRYANIAHRAAEHAASQGASTVHVDHVLTAVASAGQGATKYLAAHGVVTADVILACELQRQQDAGAVGVALHANDMGQARAGADPQLPIAEPAHHLISALEGGTVQDLVECAKEPSGYLADVLRELGIDVHAIQAEDAAAASPPKERLTPTVKGAMCGTTERFLAAPTGRVMEVLCNLDVVQEIIAPECRALSCQQDAERRAVTFVCEPHRGNMTLTTVVNAVPSDSGTVVQWETAVTEASGRFSRLLGITHSQVTFSIESSGSGTQVVLREDVRPLTRWPWLYRPLMTFGAESMRRRKLDVIQRNVESC